MRNTLIEFTLLALLTFASCKKTPSSNPGGSWTWKGATYLTSSCIGSDSLATLTDTSRSAAGTASSVTFSFFYTLPTGNGKYTVIGSAIPFYPTQVSISATLGNPPVTYQSTGTGGPTISASYLSSGLINLTGTGIEMVNTTNSADSAAISFNITQLQ